MTDKVEFHTLLIDYKRAVKKALRKDAGHAEALALVRAEVKLIDYHQQAVSDAVEVTAENGEPHRFSVTE